MNALRLWGPVVALFAVILSTLPLGPAFGLFLERLGSSSVIEEHPLPSEGQVVVSSSGVTAVIQRNGALSVHSGEHIVHTQEHCVGIDVASSEVLCAAGDSGLVRVGEDGRVVERARIPGSVVRVTRVGRSVAAALASGELAVWTLDDGQLTLRSRVATGGNQLVDLFAVDGAVVAVDAAGVLIGVSLSNPSQPEVLGVSRLGSRLHSMTAYGNLGLVAADTDGVLLIDLSDLGQIPVTGALDLGTVTDVHLSNGLLMWAQVQGQGTHAIINTLVGPLFTQSPRGVESDLTAIEGAPPRQAALRDNTLVFVDTLPSHDRLIFGVGILALLGLAAMVLPVVVRRPEGWRGKLGWMALGAVALAWLLADRGHRPIEALHILEYGALGALIIRAIRPIGGGLSGVVLAIVIGACAALLDETVQFLLPTRSGDLDDVWLDVQAGLIGAVVAVQLWTAERRVSWSWPSFVGGGLVLAIVLFQHVTVGYGYRHQVDDLAFYSRLELDALRRLDAEQGAEHADILERTAAMGYGIFLAEYSASSNPFLYELRVHLFRRDRRLEKGDEPVACGEERLLQTFFAASYEGTSWQWPDSMGARCDAYADVPYDSPVSQEIIVGSGPLRLWGGGLLGAIFLIGMGFRFRQRGM